MDDAGTAVIGDIERAVIEEWSNTMSDGNARHHFLKTTKLITSFGSLARNCSFLSVLLTFCLTPAARAESIVNGSFETGVLTPWATTGGIGASVIGTSHATDGSRIALIGFDPVFGSSTGTLFQSFNLANAGLVDFAFQAGRSEVTGPFNDVGLSFTARIDGIILSTTLPAFDTASGGFAAGLLLLSNYSGSLLLSAGAHELAFEFSRQPTLFGRGPFFGLDGVSVSPQVASTETPVPAALPLFATGLAVLGLLARRRRKATAAA